MRIGALEQEAEQEDLPEQIQYRGNDWITGLNSPVTVHPTCVYWIISVIYPMVVMVMVARRCVYTATFGHAESGDGAHVAWHRQRRHLIMKQRQLPAPPEVVYTIAGTPTNPPSKQPSSSPLTHLTGHTLVKFSQDGAAAGYLVPLCGHVPDAALHGQ